MTTPKTPTAINEFNCPPPCEHGRVGNCDSCRIRQLETELSEAVKLNSNEHGIFDPDYARVFTQARIIAWQFGYACLAHGSFTRDLDLLLVPWTENASVPIAALINRIADVAGLKLQGEPSNKPHGRKAWSLLFPGFNDPRWVDISAFEPSKTDDQLKKELEEVKSCLEALSKEIHTMGSDNVKLNAQLSTLTKAGDGLAKETDGRPCCYGAAVSATHSPECKLGKALAEWQRVKKESGL